MLSLEIIPFWMIVILSLENILLRHKNDALGEYTVDKIGVMLSLENILKIEKSDALIGKNILLIERSDALVEKCTFINRYLVRSRHPLQNNTVLDKSDARVGKYTADR